jgi:hypothetical protein
MSNQPAPIKLLVETVPLVLEVDGGNFKLELKLAWSFRAQMLIETRLREYGVRVNFVQHAQEFWVNIDSVCLAVALWATSVQAHGDEFSSEAGFERLVSYITPDNFTPAVVALKEAYLQSLSEATRERIRKTEAGEEIEAPADPMAAPVQA